MTDLKTYSSIQINEAFWRKMAPIALDLLCFLVVYYSPQIKRGITLGGIKTVEAISEFLKYKFPKVYSKILQNKKMANFLSKYPEIIEEFVEFTTSFATSRGLDTKTINAFAKTIVSKLPEDKIEEIKSLLKNENTI